jgi:hypothetical protein
MPSAFQSALAKLPTLTAIVLGLAVIATPVFGQTRLPPPSALPRWVPQPSGAGNPNLLPVPNLPPPRGNSGNRYLPPPPSSDLIPAAPGLVLPPAEAGRVVNVPAPLPAYMPANCQGLSDTYGVSIRGGYACLTRPVSATPGGRLPSGRGGSCQAYPGSRRVRLPGGYGCF